MAAPVPCCCLVPQEAVSLFAGEDGATVHRIQQESGADVHISGEEDTPPALMDRIVTIRGTSDQKEAACRAVVRITHQSQEVREGEEGIFVLIVPESATGFIIGPKGSTISSLIEATHAEVSISRNTIAGTHLQPISLTGSLVQSVAAAGRINALLQQLADRGRLQPEAWQPQPQPDLKDRERGRPGARAPARGEGAGRGSRGGGEKASGAITPAKSPASGSSRSPTPGGAGSGSSRSPTPTSSLTPGTGRGRRSGAGGTEGGSASSRSNSRGAAELGGGGEGGEEGSVGLLVEAAAAAWIVGKKGRTIADMCATSGASIDVARSEGPTRLAEIKGSRKAKAAAIGLLLEAIDGYPGGVPGEARLLVPAALADAFGGHEGNEWQRELEATSGAELDVEESGSSGDLLLVFSGGRAAVTKAAQLAAVRLAEVHAAAAAAVGGGAGGGPGKGRGGSPTPSTGQLPAQPPAAPAAVPAAAPTAAPAAAAAPQPAAGPPAAPAARRRTPSPVAAAALRAPGGAEELAAAAAVTSATSASSEKRARSLTPPGRSPSVAGSPSEAALLQALLAGPEPNKAQLQLALPLDFVHDTLTGQLRTIAARSGSRLELGPQHGASGAAAAARLLTVTGTMLGNSMAILYVQELMQQGKT